MAMMPFAFFPMPSSLICCNISGSKVRLWDRDDENYMYLVVEDSEPSSADAAGTMNYFLGSQ